MLNHYAFIGLFGVVAVLFPVAALIVGALLGPHRATPAKRARYECGLVSQGESWIQLRVQYYVYALLFLVFDVETVFLYPWAAAYRQLGLFALVEAVIFLGILAVGLAYAWVHGDLQWR
ncbi:MAG: NADH-quinone oxidoreductase subunit A [Anaerolineae bacterium]|nr:NADH-quinone oxidoreductase subunit A [Anaerolineae bacterium]